MPKAIRLDKFLSSMGYGTRKDIKKIIKTGQIKVNGIIVKDSSYKVDTCNDIIIYKEKILEYEKFQYFMLNKPAGIITATEDTNQKTVIDLFKAEQNRKDLFPIGRLDKDTEGLLLITNDGQLCHELMSPRKHVSKTYFAKINGFVTENDIKQFSEGVTLDTGYKTLPSKLTIINSGQTSKIEVIIYEGKYHQVKKMFEAVNKKVIFLKRIAIGNLKLDKNLEQGCYRKLNDNELLLLKK